MLKVHFAETWNELLNESNPRGCSQARLNLSLFSAYYLPFSDPELTLTKADQKIKDIIIELNRFNKFVSYS